jgi:Flp pilus assembly protein TadD
MRIRTDLARLSWAAIVALVLGGCGATDDVEEGSVPEPNEEPEGDSGPATPRFPATDGPLWPSMARVRGEADMDLLADVAKCRECHQDAYAHWRASAHSRSSFDNPWYRAAVDDLRESAGPEASRFCAGCHDPLLLVSGRIDQDEIAPEDPLAHAGITCMVCHSVTEVTTDGNGSWVLETAPVPIPERGDAASIAAHVERVSTNPLRTAPLCGTCHRGFLTEESGNPHFVPGMDDLGPWRASTYGDTHSARIDEDLEAETCQGCHMPGERTTRGDMAAPRGELRSHRFAGGQTALVAQVGDEDQVAAVAAMLGRAATIDVATVRFEDGSSALPADGAPVEPGDTVAFDVVVRNVGTGHLFPGGVRDTQDTFITLEVRSQGGQLVAEAGTRHVDAEDDTAHQLTTVMLDGQGHPELRHFVQRFEGKGYDHTIAPRDAATTRYELTLPELPPSAFPLSVTARLLHRRHVRPMHDAACEATRSARGRAFTRAARALGNPVLNGCVPQPITEIADARVFVGEGAADHPAEGGAARQAWVRLYEHALGLERQVQERTDEARPSLDRALALLGDEGDARSRAMVLLLLARVEARQGRVDEAIATAERAQALVGDHPAIEGVRGDAYAQVWRWDQAADAYGRLIALAPGDSAGWRSYARALGSIQDDAEALRAASTGLGLAPRDEAMLRTQALALAGQGHADADRARSLFVAHRNPDRQSDLRLRCAHEVDNCARDQQPVVTIRMRVR